MVSQSESLTKSPLRRPQQFKTSGFRWKGAVIALLSPLLMLECVLPAHALVKMEPKNIDAALVYGMKHQNLGLANLLGPNWIEGQNGTLLNVYSPFMMLASKASKAGFSKRPAASDLQKARKRFGREVAFYSDPKNKVLVKFAVSFYGNTPDFAKSYSARIVGFGRGRDFELKPTKQVLDLKADPVNNGQSSGSYEAINSYYFTMAELEDLQDFRLIMESPTGEPLVFRMKNERLY